MALGYEGYVSIAGSVVLGTGASAPRTRGRLESASGYGGKINSTTEAGINAPYSWDWNQHDGTVNFEVTSDLFTTLKAWILDRQNYKVILLVSRDGNSQNYSKAFWNSMSISASDGSAVEGSVGFTALERTYAYGVQGDTGYTGNDTGQGVVSGTKPLNPSPHDLNPVPFWNTQITLASSTLDFLTWSLDLSQEMVKFFGCKGNFTVEQEPLYMAAGPMTATFTGTYLYDEPKADSISGKIDVAGTTIDLARMELQSISDDVQTGDVLVPLSVEYLVYGLS